MRVADVFGRLTVLELIPAIGGSSRPCARARCACGREAIVRRSCLVSGRTQSCGCRQRERAADAHRTHGQSIANETPEYRAWTNAKTRTTNPRYKDWRYWGARGIRMAPEWLHDFPAFFAHIGPRPGPGYSIDRIDNNGDYAPGNVRWATATEQKMNQRPYASCASGSRYGAKRMTGDVGGQPAAVRLTTRRL